MEQEKFYFLKDQYFNNFPDKDIMRNKEMRNGKPVGRPCFFAIPDKNNDKIFWFVPISSKYEKYKTIYDKKIKKRKM